MSFAARAINHALAREQWARTRMSTHAGATFAVAVGPAHATCVIEPDGTVTETDGAPGLTLTVSPLNVPTLLAQPARWNEFVAAEGNAGLAATLAELALTLPWFIEREFATLLGPIVGTRVADAGRAMLGAPAYASERLGESLARYVRDEAKLVVTKSEAHDLTHAVSDVDRRIDALASRLDVLDRESQPK
jgi:ubiquinone biosynthesis protein UbiJ